ncbi:CHAT domain-containing protein [Armillaria fumosa]|nr:CHAT domain-containing protein [Armillaria fumosa]
MSDLNDADVDPAIEQATCITFSAVHLTDFMMNLRADSHPNLLPYSMVFARCTMNGIVIQESTMIKEAKSTCWNLMESIHISTEIPSFKLSILSRYPGRDDHTVAEVELDTASLLSLLAIHDCLTSLSNLTTFASELPPDEHKKWSQVISELDNNDPAQELAFRVVAVPSERSSNPSEAFFVLPTTNGLSVPHPSLTLLLDFPAWLNNRGHQFLQRFDQFGREDDIQNAISALERSVSSTSDSNPEKLSRLSNLCVAFMRRFELLGDSRDLDQAMKSGHDAVTLADSDRDDQSSFFMNLSNSYARRLEFLGNQDDFNSVVAAAEPAVPVLYNLAWCLARRFEQLGELDDINSTIKMGRLASSLVAEGEPLKPVVLQVIAGSFFLRFTRLGKSNDLEESISETKRAIDLMPEGFPPRYVSLDNLCVLLRHRFQLFGDRADLDEAIVKGTHAMIAVPRGCLQRPGILNNLSSSFLQRFELNGDLDDITEAISLMQNSLSDTTDGHLYRPDMLAHLGFCLRRRFVKTNDANDLDEAISVGRRAVACTPDGHSKKPSQLTDLLISLQTRFTVHEHVDDLKESITCGEKALSLIPDGHPDKFKLLLYLGASVAYRFDLFQNSSDADEATSLLKSAALSPTGPPLTRLGAACEWAELGKKVDFLSALEAYKVTLDLLPRVAWTGKSIAARHRQLVRFGRTVNQAAAYALQLGYADIALEWLEMGRAIVWGQLHNLRSPVDFLSDAYPDLAKRLSQVGNALEKATSRDVNIENFKEFTMEEIAKEHRRLAAEWDSLVETVRALPGFEDFLRPKKLATLKNAAKHGPVVLLNTFQAWCDALILIPGLDDVIHIPLKDFSYEKAEILLKRLNKSLSALGVRTRASQPVPYGTSGKNVFMDVLKKLWTWIVKPVLDGLALFPCDTTNPPRLWWCPTGPLAFLPIHAAGDYNTNEPGTKLSDYVVSSYTPTLTILLEKLEKTRRFTGLLAISQPNTPGLSSLPVPEGRRGKPDTVLDGMSTCDWVHMACHATQEKGNPLDSTFCLHRSSNYRDGHLPLSRIIAKSFPNADFAYLSACQTATGDESLSEESVHLAAGMLMAGYQSVIATLWSIRDVDAPLIADEVYSRLFEDGKPDSGKAAIALHHSVQSLRKRVEDEPDSFVRWVPFIHVGV